MKTPKRFKNELVQTVIGEHTRVVGSIDTQSSLRVEGSVEGSIHSQGEVFIGSGSVTKANIVGKTVIVAGEVIGDIEAINGLQILKTGKVYGDISGDHLFIEEGAIYKGKVNMDVISSKNAYEGSVQLKRK